MPPAPSEVEGAAERSRALLVSASLEGISRLRSTRTGREICVSLAQALREKLNEAADPRRAPGMQAYMKSAMPYLGVAAVPLRLMCKTAFAGLTWPDSAA